MISFRHATDEELMVLREAIDALTLERPGLIHDDDAWSGIVHAVLNEVVGRARAAEAGLV